MREHQEAGAQRRREMERDSAISFFMVLAWAGAHPSPPADRAALFLEGELTRWANGPEPGARQGQVSARHSKLTCSKLLNQRPLSQHHKPYF